MDKDYKANFKRVAEARTNRVIDGLIHLGDISKHSYYEYTPEQIETIFTAIQETLDGQKNRLLGRDNANNEFRLR
ncbi:MAG: hypothetical protein IJT79_05120 [Ruminococcus sp.]|nr:hypothetical protein [Ruminococcus sp.]